MTGYFSLEVRLAYSPIIEVGYFQLHAAEKIAFLGNDASLITLAVEGITAHEMGDETMGFS